MSALYTTFDVFAIRFPDRETYAPFAETSAQALEGKLPDELIALFREEGLFTFAEGLFMLVDPVAMRPVNESWGFNADENFIFLRTAFGDFFYWDDSGANVMHVNSGVTNTLDSDMADFLNYTFSEGYREKTLFGKLLKQAQATFGPYSPEECYGFTIPIDADGKETIGNLKKVNLFEQLAKLAR